MTPKDLQILSIKAHDDLILDEDKADVKANYFKDNVGLRPGGQSILFERDHGTKHRMHVPPLRPNAVKYITGAANNGSGLVRITCASHGYSTGNTVFIDEIVGTVEANGIWSVTVINSSTYDLVGSAFVHAYTSGGISTTTPISIVSIHTFYDKETLTEYEIVAGLDSSNNLRLYVYDSASTEKSKWIELSRYFTATAKATPAATAKTIDIENVQENGITPTGYPYADGSLNNWVVVNTSQSNETAFILNSVYGAFGVLTTDTVLGANGLGWNVTDVLQIYRFPCFKFNYTYAHGATPWADWLPVTEQRKVNFLHQATDGTKYQAIQIMHRSARNYFYDSSSATYLRTLPAGWYCESEFGILNPFAATYGALASPKSPGGGNFTTLAASGASNATPIVVTVSSTVGLSTGDIVVGSGFTTNTAANAMYSITVINATTFSLDGSVGNGATSSGTITVYKNIGQIYDKTSGRNWLNLFANLSNGSTARASAQIIFNTPVNGDTIRVVILVPSTGAPFSLDAAKGAAYVPYAAGTGTFTTAADLTTIISDFISFWCAGAYTATNSSGTITIAAVNAGSLYNGSLLYYPMSPAGTLAISNASQGATSAAFSTRNFEGGVDTTSVYSQARIYVTAGYGGYEESDPILQAFLQGDTTAQPPDITITPIFSFALMNKELTHLYMYAAFANPTVIGAGWKDAPEEYLLHFSLPIQSATTDSGYIATEWTDKSTSIKAMMPVYSYDMSQGNKMQANPTIYDAKKTAGAENINDELNHAVDMNRTYPTPRFATEATRGDGTILLIDDGDLSGRLSNYNASGTHEDDNFPDVRTDNNGNKLKISFHGTGEILGLEIMNDTIYLFRKLAIETYDLQGVYKRTYQADVCAKKSILSTPYGIAFGGNASIFLIPSDGSQIVPLNPLGENYYAGNQFVSGTTPFVTQAYRNDMVFGYNQLYKELWVRLKVNTASSTEIRNFRYSFEQGRWYTRIVNTSDEIRCFSYNLTDASFTIATEKSILKYPNRSGSNIYQDDVRVTSEATEIPRSLIVQVSADMNIALFNQAVTESMLHGFLMDIVADSSDGYGIFNVDFFANRETAPFDTQYVRADEKMEYREVEKRGAIDRLSIKLSLDSTSTVGRLDIMKNSLGFLPNRKLQNL